MRDIYKSIQILLLTTLIVLVAGCSNKQPAVAGEYTGANAERYYRDAIKKLEQFYTQLIDAASQPDITNAYISGIAKEMTEPDAVFLPDFIQTGSQNKVSSLEHYTSLLQDAYKSYLETYQINPKHLQFMIDDSKPGQIFFTQNGGGVRVQVSYRLSVLAGQQSVFAGRSTAIVVFPDFMNTIKFRIAQITPLKKLTVQQPAVREDLNEAEIQPTILPVVEVNENKPVISNKRDFDKYNKDLGQLLMKEYPLSTLCVLLLLPLISILISLPFRKSKGSIVFVVLMVLASINYFLYLYVYFCFISQYFIPITIISLAGCFSYWKMRNYNDYPCKTIFKYVYT